MSPWTAVPAVALLVAAITWWWYGRREEKVRGRGAAAALRAAALFLILSSPWLPALFGGKERPSSVAVLVDRSLSMRLPSGGSGSRPRMDVALGVVEGLRQARTDAVVWSFGSRAARLETDSVSDVEADGRASRALEAVEAARAAGADSVVLVTDGELEDREASRRLADRLGIGVAEVVVAEAAPRAAIRSVSAPRVVEAGDSFEVRARIVAAGTMSDSVRLTSRFGERPGPSTRIVTPGPGRTSEAALRLAAGRTADMLEWRSLDLVIEGQEAPWDSAARFRTWIGVSPVPQGAVFISTSPDWESRYLVPLLDRSIPGGARGFIRLGRGSWVRTGSRDVGAAGVSEVRRAASAATLLVIQGAPGDLPGWLSDAARQRPAVLFLVRGAGTVPGTDIRAIEPLEGEWFAETPAPPGPIGPAMLGIDAGEQPPVGRLFRSDTGGARVALAARRDRVDESEPIVVFGSESGRRRAAILGEGTWRWATRPGQGIELYRGLYEGLGRWLTERAIPRPIELIDSGPRAGDSLVWRVAPAVRDLSLRIESPEGGVVWSDSLPEPGERVVGPRIGGGELRAVASGTVGGDPFRLVRPVHGNASLEYVPRPTSPELRSAGAARKETSQGRRDRPPVWPFALALGFLCAEWLWRRRVGLK